MQLIQIIGIGLVATSLIIILRKQRPEFALMASIATGSVIFMMVASRLASIIELLGTYADKAEIKPVFFTTVLKVMGIAYITEFGSDICRDAGENAIASKIELAGKITIVALAVPVITALLDMVIKIMP